MSQIRGFFKRITGEPVSHDALTKQPVADAEIKLKLFNDATSVSINGLESYIKSLSKLVDLQLAEKFNECKDLFSKYEKPNDQIMGTVFFKLNDIQKEMHNEIVDLIKNIDACVLKPLCEYQKELAIVKENKKELKDAYDKIDQTRQNLEKVKREAENSTKGMSQTHRMTIMNTSMDGSNKKFNDMSKLEEKVLRNEKELEEATSMANEKYDKYTESLYKRIADECELSTYYLNYLNTQRKYHKRALKKLDALIPSVDESIRNYHKKPVFGYPLDEYVQRSNMLRTSQQQQQQQNQLVSPVVRNLIDGMCNQNAFSEEGIFRIAGSRIKMNCLVYAINAGYLEYLNTTKDFDIHCLAGVLKQYLRELPDSLLCNSLYDDWISAINTSPLSKKQEAFRGVLQKLPKVNYENLRYLIKFLAKIVENSEKTKMTTANMGICFGVSLLSSNNGLMNSNNNAIMTNSVSAINSLSDINNQSNTTSNANKSIDMSTATNVFDFILSNHNEIFPGEISFKQVKSISNSTLSKATASSQLSENNATVITRRTNNQTWQKEEANFESPSSSSTNTNRLKEESANEPHVVYNSPFPRVIQNVSSPGASMNSGNITNVNRHIKQASYESRPLENDQYSSNNSINSIGNSATTTNSNGNNKIASSSPQQNVYTFEPGSTSPKVKSKKQAPAPPPVSKQNESASSTSSSSTNQSNSNENSASNNTTSIYPKLMPGFNPKSSSTTSSTTILTNNNNNNKIINETSSFSTTPENNLNEISTNQTLGELPRPNIPPPNVPNRAPPIGFNISFIPSESESSFPTSMPMPSTIDTSCSAATAMPVVSCASSPSSSTSSQEMLNSPNNPNQQLSKGPKPAVPRRPSGKIAANIKKFQTALIGDLESNDETKLNKSSLKSTSEITSL